MGIVVLSLAGCSGNGVNGNQADKGRLLAARYCQSCHMLPHPSLLTRTVWNNSVLPVMGLYLGMNNGLADRHDADSMELAVLPMHPVLDTMEWRLIRDYYTTMAPDALPILQKVHPAPVPFFSVQLPPDSLYSHVSVTSYCRIDTSVSPRRMLIGHAITNRLLVFNDQLQQLQSFDAGGAVTDIIAKKDRLMVCTIGQQVAPDNTAGGKITGVSLNKTGLMKADPSPLFEKLARPVRVTEADLANEGNPGYLISAFGNLAGELSWMQHTGKGSYTKHVLRNRPGAVSTIVQDCNKDGLPDVWALFAQGEEGIFLYTNKGGGRFEEKQVLRFPPSYGSTSFELVDFNHDGFSDILYTCGDNADYSQILKPYHGVYIFLNDGNNQFRQSYFYPINGCYKALARDFDGDGDPDIATVSFYPAAVTPWEAFVYLENKGHNQFQPYTLPAGTPFQKGVTMDAGNLDGDGRTDLLLGSGFFTTDSNGDRQPLFIVLRNVVGGSK